MRVCRRNLTGSRLVELAASAVSLSCADILSWTSRPRKRPATLKSEAAAAAKRLALSTGDSTAFANALATEGCSLPLSIHRLLEESHTNTRGNDVKDAILARMEETLAAFRVGDTPVDTCIDFEDGSLAVDPRQSLQTLSISRHNTVRWIQEVIAIHTNENGARSVLLFRGGGLPKLLTDMPKSAIIEFKHRLRNSGNLSQSSVDNGLFLLCNRALQTPTRRALEVITLEGAHLDSFGFTRYCRAREESLDGVRFRAVRDVLFGRRDDELDDFARACGYDWEYL